MLSSILSAALCFSVVSGLPVATQNNNQGPRYALNPESNNSFVAPYPTYRALTDFDYESFNVALYQEWIELDLFEYGVTAFSAEEWQDAGAGPDYVSLLQFMSNQESGHAELLTNIMGRGNAPKRCTYNYTGAFTDVRSYIEFNERLTRWGESGVVGFLTLLNSRDSAHLLQQSIHTEARQQMVFRMFSGSQPMPVYFESGIPQAWAWTQLAPYIQSCPADNPKVGWSNFPALRIPNQPLLAYAGSKAAISTNRTALTAPGQTFNVEWEKPGKTVGPDGAYKTAIMTENPAKFALLVTQLNATYVELGNIDYSANTATFTLPETAYLYDPNRVFADPVLNGTGFIALTSSNPYVSAYNLSMINKYVVAGPTTFHFG